MYFLILLCVFVALAYGQIESSTNPTRLNFNGVIINTADNYDNVQSRIYPLPKGSSIHEASQITTPAVLRGETQISSRTATPTVRFDVRTGNRGTTPTAVLYGESQTAIPIVKYASNSTRLKSSAAVTSPRTTPIVKYVRRTGRRRKQRPKLRPIHEAVIHHYPAQGSTSLILTKHPSSGIKYYNGSTHIGNNFQVLVSH